VAASTTGGDDAEHDLSDEKDRLEMELRAEARRLFRQGRKKERDRLINRSNEISRKKSKRAQHH
jgi:hypothetical protein